MELNGISSSAYASPTYATTAKTSQPVADTATTTDTAAVFEKAEETKSATYSSKNPKVDQATIDKLKADAEARYSQLRSLVEKLITKQSETSGIASLSDLMNKVVSGEIQVDPETVEQAKKDVAEDGYWGVEQTADRIVSFAKALTGGDAGKIEEMRDAIEKGYEEAGKLWGDELPEISQKTLNRVNELLDEWVAESTAQ